uniref:dihydroxyacetone kinase subunit DhaL n=1 Tax=Microbacterium sp. TaxID=51671 RepID=UPI00289E79CD
MMASIDTAALVDWIHRFRDAVTEKRDWLTELDSAIGDADHGANMARGMDAVVAKLDAGAPATVDELLKAVGMTLVSSVGGASGPLYGTLFLRMGMAAGPVTELDATALAASLRAGLDGIVARGKAEAGDKTMFDAMAPAVDALDAAIAGGAGLGAATQSAAQAAADGR